LHAALRQRPPHALVVCTPISTIAAVSKSYQESLRGSATLFFHAGSLLSPQLLGLDEGGSSNVLGTHPLAGDTSTGFESARGDLFADCTVVVQSSASAIQLAAASAIWKAAGAARLVSEDAAAHDSRMSIVSHLPQLSSVLLALTIAQHGQTAADLGTGGRDATRLAKSPFPMWKDILQLSRNELVPLLQGLHANTGLLLEKIKLDDWQAVQSLWRSGAAIYDTPAAPKAAGSGGTHEA
jgi:prephenate dehydrogenase